VAFPNLLISPLLGMTTLTMMMITGRLSLLASQNSTPPNAIVDAIGDMMVSIPVTA
jgi:hypothetical protein